MIDGLDECEQHCRKEIISFFKDMVKLCDSQFPGKLRVLFLSRDEPDIRKSFSDVTELSIQPEYSQADIGIFVRHEASRLRDNGRFNELTDRDVEFIEHRVLDAANGVFIVNFSNGIES